jgi:hypothetical protein
MKKLLLATALLLTACTPTAKPTESYDFKYSYGIMDVTAQNELNTFNDTFTKDMIVDEPITVTMKLSERELDTIIYTINRYDLFSEEPQGDIRMIVSPCESYALEVRHGTETKTVEWNCETKTADRTTFAAYMQTFIEGKEEYKALPEPQGGYM